MKLLLVLVSVIAVFSAEDRDFRIEPNIQDPTNEAQHFSLETVDQAKELHIQDGSDGPNSSEEESKLSGGQDLQNSTDQIHQLKERKGQYERRVKRSSCKARNSCVVMGGFCVTNATLCSGRLVPEGCKRLNCQCCVPGIIEGKFDNLEKEIQSLKENMNNSNSIHNSQIQSLQVSMNSMNSNLNSEIQSLNDNVNNSLSNMNSKLGNQGCPQGFFHLSNQCFKYFDDANRSWEAGKSKCASEGLILAKPNAPLALRSYLVMRNANGRNSWAWLGARGTGSVVNWERDGKVLTTNNPMWMSGHPGSRTSSSYCLVSLVTESYMKSQPTAPYYMYTCTGSEYTLCELLKE